VAIEYVGNRPFTIEAATAAEEPELVRIGIARHIDGPPVPIL
jgi:hypothetical protein